MAKLFRKRAEKAALPPGTPVYVGEAPARPVRLSIIDYNGERFESRQAESAESCQPYVKTSTVTWINVDGIHEPDVIECLGRDFGLHPLTIEDIVNTSQRPKVEDLDGYVYIVLRMLYGDAREKGGIQDEQVSLILGRNFVISFQERPGDVFDAVRERLRLDKGRIRRAGPDYLAYSLIDAIVDHYFLILEGVGERVEALEERLIADPRPETLQEIHRLKRQMIFLRRAVWPLREATSALARAESPLIDEGTRAYLRDVYDHTVQVIDVLEAYRDVIAGMLDTYLSSLSNRMNEVMKVLTVIATIFIPMTFIAGVYGMNFESMPELKLPWGYAAAWGAMIAVGLGMLLYFRRKRWL